MGRENQIEEAKEDIEMGKGCRKPENKETEKQPPRLEEIEYSHKT